MRRWAATPAVRGAVALVGAAAVAHGQEIAGQVRDAAGAAVPGAVLVLVDTSGHRLASTLSRPDGRYAITVGGAGTFWLRVTVARGTVTTSPAFALEPGEEVAYDHVVPSPSAEAALTALGRACPTSAPRGGWVGTPPTRVRLVDEGTGAPVPNAIVALLDSDGRLRSSGTTDPTGIVGLGARPEHGDVLCARRLGMPLAVREAREAPDDRGIPWLVLVRAPARELSTVEVRASRLEEMRLRGLPTTARYFTREDFAAYVPAALNFGDLLRPMNAPSVSLRASNGRVNCVLVRGTNCVPTLLDGVPSNTVYDLDPDMVDGIAVLTPIDAAQRYGNLGRDGLVIIYSKRTLPKKGEKTP